MHVTACLAGQKVDVEVGENCRTLQALKESIVVALPQLCVEGFDVSVGGRALDDDESSVSLEMDVCLDVTANTRVLSVLALREAGREVSEAGLLAAASEGDVSLVTLYLDAGVPIDCKDDDDKTPLLIACRWGHVEVARLLLDRGSTVIDAKDRRGYTPLRISCVKGHVEIARLLLDRGSTVIEDISQNRNVPLQLSCSNGHVEITRLLLDRGCTAIDERGILGGTPLHRSCGEGYLEIARLLLDRGSTAMDKRSVYGETPLLLACGNGRLEIATLLLDRGSTAIDEKNNAGETPLSLACLNGHVGTARLLLDRGCDFDVESYRRGDPCGQPVLELLSQRGYDVQPRTDA